MAGKPMAAAKGQPTATPEGPGQDQDQQTPALNIKWLDEIHCVDSDDYIDSTDSKCDREDSCDDSLDVRSPEEDQLNKLIEFHGNCYFSKIPTLNIEWLRWRQDNQLW